MEGISRKDLDIVVNVLTNTGHDEYVKIAEKITKMDIIPKLYVYTYVKKVRDELKLLKGDQKSIDQDEFESLIEEQSKLQLHMFNTSTEANKLLKFLENGFTREHQFCDFDDSKFHGQTKIGPCESEDHNEIQDEPVTPLTDEEQKEFDKIEDEKCWDDAREKFQKNFNPDVELKPIWYPDDETKKWDDEDVRWICHGCLTNNDAADSDFDVSCDMDAD